MVKSVIGGVVMWLIGFVFWGTPLRYFAFHTVDDSANAAVQQALAQHLTVTGTGTYVIPSPDTAGGSVLFGQGPIALVHFNTSGFPVVDSGALIGGLVLAIVCALLVALGLRAIAAGTDFRQRVTLVVLTSLAAAGYFHLGQPVFNHAPWGYFIYLFLSDFIALAVAGLIIARWFTAAPEPQLQG